MIKKVSAVIFLLILVAACTPKEKEQVTKEAPKETTSAVMPAAGTKIVANNFSDKNKWKAGVMIKKDKKNMFYFLYDPATANPVAVGTKLVFAKSGAANVTKVETGPQGGRIAAFVTVDHDLDPVGDGFPNPILVQ